MISKKEVQIISDINGLMVKNIESMGEVPEKSGAFGIMFLLVSSQAIAFSVMKPGFNVREFLFDSGFVDVWMQDYTIRTIAESLDDFVVKRVVD